MSTRPLKRLKCGNVSDTLMEAMEHIEGAEHVLIIIDLGGVVRVSADDSISIAQANYSLDLAKSYLLSAAKES